MSRNVLLTLLVALSVLSGLNNASAATDRQLSDFITNKAPESFFPDAERLGPVSGTPAVAIAYRGDEELGYVFLNSDFVDATGYSGKPIHMVVAMAKDGTLKRISLVEHHEPIVLIGIPEKRITAVLDGYVGRNVVAIAREEEEERQLDIVSGATVTIMVMEDSILRSAIKVARRFKLGGLIDKSAVQAKTKASVEMSVKTVLSWDEMVANGAVRRLNLSVEEVNRAFIAGGDEKAIARPEPGPPEVPFIELYTALVSVPSIGLSLLGEAEYRNLTKRLQPNQQAILLLGRGRYSFKGSGYVRGGIFDRFHVVQGDNSLRFRDRTHKRLRQVKAEGAPEFTEIDLFRTPKKSTLDPVEPWRLELLIGRLTGPTSKAFVAFTLGYQLPDTFIRVESLPNPVASVVEVATEAPPLWQKLWRQKRWEIVVLGLALGFVTVLFFVQDWMVRAPVLTERVRIGFLIFTLFGLGFYANAQLSVVNVMTFLNALLTNFSWTYFLMEPLIFMLWFSVGASLMFWGRGAFCGWLCPFGALQELLNKIAKAFKVPQVSVPWWLHERLWPLKYMIFLVLFGISLYSIELAERLAEVEPFKTSIILKFDRDWPYVLFAVALLAAGLFIERFYCRYLCPLGAALAIPGRLRMFEWLRRYKECGSPCQRCSNECMVGAIHPDGHINPNECLYCLNCQVLYHHDHNCPVLIQRRLKRERRAALASTQGPETLPASAGGTRN